MGRLRVSGCAGTELAAAASDISSSVLWVPVNGYQKLAASYFVYQSLPATMARRTSLTTAGLSLKFEMNDLVLYEIWLLRSTLEAKMPVPAR